MSEQPRSTAAITAAEYSAAVARYSREASDFDEYVMRASLNLIRTANTLVQASERVHRPHGLSWAGFSVLFTLTVFGDLEARTIARLTGVSKQAASLVLATLERDGYVERTRGVEGDRRLVQVSLTRRGHAAAHSGLEEQADLASRLLADLNQDEVSQLNALLERVLQTASRVGGPA